METVNGFITGMRQDRAVTKHDPSSYLEAWNMKIITKEGRSTASMTNTKGNQLLVTLPDTSALQKIYVNSSYGVGQNITITTTSAPQTGAGFETTSSTTGQDLYNYLDSDAAYTNFGVDYDVYVAPTYIVIYPRSGITLTASVTAGLTHQAAYVPAQTNLTPIGYTTVRDEIYIFSTKQTNTSKNPGGHDPSITTVDATTVGQIWRLTYDKVEFVPTLKLIYCNYIDFTLYHPIPPSATVGRYENDGIKRIYWSDNFNRVRTLNVADEHAMALDPSILNIRPSIDFSIPILQEITSGHLIVGCYHLAYRLKNSGGATTNFSEPSNPIFIATGSEAANTGGAGFKDYVGANPGTGAAKAIKFKITNLDTDFDRIEIIKIFRSSPTAVPEISVVIDDNIPPTGEYINTIAGNETETPVTYEEFLAISSNFTHCKTMTAKDNVLIVGNLRNIKSDIDYDARAYRYPNGGITTEVDGVVRNQTYLHDTIQNPETDNNINTLPNSQRYRYGSAVLGGDGPNISFEFGTVAIRCDSGTNITGTPSLDLINNSPAPYRQTYQDYASSYIDLNVAGQTYPTNSINQAFKYPYYSSTLRGYQRSETYRFAIQFFDKEKNPFFAKWIGDIKMPNHYDANNNAFFQDGTAVPAAAYTDAPGPDFRTSLISNASGVDQAYVQSLYIKFNVTIPAALTDRIGGYSIVRVERTQEDKSILGQGVIGEIVEGYGYYWRPDIGVHEHGNLGSGGTPIADARPTLATFTSPEFTFSNSIPSLQSTDRLKLVSICRKVNSTFQICPTTTCNGTNNIIKNYRNIRTSTVWDTATLDTPSSLAMTQINNVDIGSTAGVNGTTFYNMDNETANTSTSIGGRTMLVHFSGSGISTYAADLFYDTLSERSRKYIANYVRSVTNQYGGNTYIQRSNNEYISTGHFQPVATSAIAVTHSPKIFGGDTFVSLVDIQVQIKNFGQTGRAQGADPRTALTIYFPVETSINTDLRHGSHVNKNLITDTNSGADACYQEGWDYNSVYSAEMTLKKYYPKPIDFNNNEVFDNRFQASEVKINGEDSDSWSVFKVNNIYDVEGMHGPINSMELVNNEIVFWQRRAFGMLAVNPRVALSGTSGEEVQTGKGAVLDNHRYISLGAGLSHQWAHCKSAYSVFWLDSLNKRMYKYTPGGGMEPISDTKEMQSWFNNNLIGTVIEHDIPTHADSNYNNCYASIVATYDTENSEALFTIQSAVDSAGGYVQTAHTIAFDEKADAYSTFYSFKPQIYINDGISLFSVDRNSMENIYLHNKGNYGRYYGQDHNSIVKITTNPHPHITKVFDNYILHTEVIDSSSNQLNETFTGLIATNDFQTTGSITLTAGSNIKRRERTWNLAVPRATGSTTPSTLTARMRDIYMDTQLSFINNNNKRLVVHDIITTFRPSNH